jgi:fluoroquinolone resistance protein
MSKTYTQDKHFNGEDFSEERLPKGEYENCTFNNCVFAHSNLSEVSFTDCSFENCDLSMAKLKHTSFRDVTFTSCKLLGLRFDDCNPFLLSFSFEGCILNFSSFFRLKLKKTVFRDCRMQEVELVEADLSQSVFAACDLSGAVFEKTLLEGADLGTAMNYTIDPETNRIAKAKFALDGLPGLLAKYRIVVK